MLIDRVVVEVSPKEVVSHLVSLVQPGWSHRADLEVMTATPPLLYLRVTPAVRISHKPFLALTARISLPLPYALRPEAAFEYTAGVAGACYSKGLVVYPASYLTVTILPHCGHQIRTVGHVLAVLNPSVQQAGLSVHQPVSPALRLIEQIKLPGVMSVYRSVMQASDEIVLTQLCPMFTDGGRVVAGHDDLAAVTWTAVL